MRTLTTALLATVLLGSNVALAATPNLAALRPAGAQRGTEVEVSLSGARLGDAQEILYYQPGIQTLALTKVDDNNVKAKLKIAPDAPLGLHDLRLRTATGISEHRTFSVGALPEVVEAEPNNEFAKPQPIAFNSVVNGVADNEDVDYYVIDAKKGDRITAEVEGIRLGITLFDPFVAIMDTKRFELASSDDAALIWQDGVASVIAPADGQYIIQVRESAYAGNGACLYRLHVGTFPRPTATVPGGGKLGESLPVTWIGDVAGPKVTNVALPAAPDPNFGVAAQDAGGIAPYPNAFRLSPFGNVIEVEPNNDPNANATPFTPPLAVNGVIGQPEDNDYFVFKAAKGQVFDIWVYARRLRSPLDPVLHILKKGGAYLAGNDDSPAGPDSYLRFQAPEDGEYVLWLHDHLKKGGPEYAYRIEVSPAEPKLTMSVANEGIQRGTGNINVTVPKGNRQAILVNATRVDFGGELAVTAEGLPAGLELKADPMAANLATYPVLLEAKADAPTAGALARFLGAPTDPNVKLASQNFQQIAELVNGQNNVPFWTRTVDRFAIAVTEECPYSIEIVEPKVPLVRGGSMGLKVVAKRKEGFTAPIAVSLPWNPPGVGSAGGVSIPEGQSEAIIPLNADGGAELKTWKIVVNGSSAVPSGPIMVSTQLANLTIAAPYVGLTYQNTACEQGKAADLVVKIAKAVDFEGEATMTLIGLPNKAATEVKKITKDTPEVVFHITTAADTPAGNHQNLFCQVVVTANGEPIVHNIGTGALRVDVPLPPKADAPAPAPMPAAAPAPMPEAPKVLSRLEQPRQEQAAKAKAAAAEAKP
jgi:hypothetical protein